MNRLQVFGESRPGFKELLKEKDLKRNQFLPGPQRNHDTVILALDFFARMHEGEDKFDDYATFKRRHDIELNTLKEKAKKTENLLDMDQQQLFQATYTEAHQLKAYWQGLVRDEDLTGADIYRHALIYVGMNATRFPDWLQRNERGEKLEETICTTRRGQRNVCCSLQGTNADFVFYFTFLVAQHDLSRVVFLRFFTGLVTC